MSNDTPKTFIELCLAGKVSVNDIDDFVDEWHEGAGKVSLRESVGMSEQEYSLWINDPSELSRILASRKLAAF